MKQPIPRADVVHNKPPYGSLITTGFLGRRDGYEVPLALHENHLLDTHLGEWRPKNQRRVPTTWIGTTALAAVRRSNLLASTGWHDPYHGADATLGKILARRSRLECTRALVYSYHWPGYLAAGGDPRSATLFMVHPHPGLIRSSLGAARDMDPAYGHLSMEPEEQWSGKRSAAVDAALAKALHVVCTSAFVAEGIRSLTEGNVTPVIVPYGANKVRRGERRTRGPLQLLWVGQPSYRKGFYHLIRALEQLGPLIQLRCLMRAAKPLEQIRLPPNVVVQLNVDDDSLQKHYQAADAFVMPSLAEGFGLALLEALAHGLPVITTARTGVAGIVKDYNSGILVEPGDTGALSQALAGLAGDYERLAAMSQSATASAGPYTWTRFRAGIRDNT